MRFSDLVELQAKLPRQLNPQASRQLGRWDKIRTMVKAGLFTPNLVATAQRALKMGLHPIPALPRKQTIVNLYPTLDAINLLESNHRKAGRWLMHHTKAITFRELCHSIKLSCQQLRDSILEWDDYYLLSIQGKSQQWMADIAYRYLPVEQMPKGVLQIGHHTAGEDLFKHLKESGSNNFILFDDGAYSARQFHNYLDSLIFYLKKNGSFLERKNICFVFGHFPIDRYLEANYQKLVEDFNVRIHLISKFLTQKCLSLMEKENLTPALKGQIGDLAATWRPQLATEWKRPDYMSTALFISEGYLGEFSRAKYGELNAPNGSVERLHGIGPLTDILPPYAKARS